MDQTDLKTLNQIKGPLWLNKIERNKNIHSEQ